MPTQVSLTSLQGMLAQNTDVVWLVKIAITHPDISQTLRYVNDKVDHTDGSGNVWTAWPFNAVLANEDGETMPKADIVMSNVDRRVIFELRQLSSSPQATLEVVTDQAFDTPEHGPVDIDILGYDATAAELRLSLGPAVNYLDAAFPADRFLPSNAAS